MESYTRCVEYFLTYRIKTEDCIHTIDRELIKKLVLHLQSKDKAPKTVNLYKSAVMFFCNEVLHLHIDPLPLARENKKLPVILSFQEVKQLIDSYTNPNNSTIWTYCLFEFNNRTSKLIKFKEQRYKGSKVQNFIKLLETRLRMILVL